MRTVEHAVDIWDLRGMSRKLDSGMLLAHLLVFKRVTEAEGPGRAS